LVGLAWAVPIFSGLLWTIIRSGLQTKLIIIIFVEINNRNEIAFYEVNGKTGLLLQVASATDNIYNRYVNIELWDSLKKFPLIEKVLRVQASNFYSSDVIY